MIESLNEGQQLPGQQALSTRIRERLQEKGIGPRLDEAAARLLPDQVR